MKKIYRLYAITLSLFYCSIAHSANYQEPETDRHLFYNAFGDTHLATGVSNISLLVGEDLKRDFHDVIVVVVSREDRITAHIKTFFGRDGEQIANAITLSNFIGNNVTLTDSQYTCTGLSGAVIDIEGSLKDRFRIKVQGNDRHTKDSMYCIGFNLVGGRVQIFDYDKLKERFCPGTVKNTTDPLRVFYKNRFSKLVLNEDAIRAVRKAFADQLANVPITNYGFVRHSHGYAMELLDEASISFPQNIGGWIPTYDYLAISPMQSFIRKINYAEDNVGLSYYSGGSANKNKLRAQLNVGIT